MRTIETTIRPAIKSHYERLQKNKENIDFRKLKPPYIVENYYLVHMTFPPRQTTLNDWIVNELINESRDILLVFSQADLQAFRDFKNPMYKKISKIVFDGLVGRIKGVNEDLGDIYSVSNYKVMSLGFTSTRFQTKIFDTVAKQYPKAELLLGFN